MADISSTTTLVIRRLSVSRLGFPAIAIGASLRALSHSIARAFEMLYVDPYTAGSRRDESDMADNPRMRDPRW